MYVERPTREVADMGPLVGMAVVGLVAILGTGLLMQLVHRPDGWPVARFLMGPSSTGALVLQGGLGLVALGDWKAATSGAASVIGGAI